MLSDAMFYAHAKLVIKAANFYNSFEGANPCVFD